MSDPLHRAGLFALAVLLFALASVDTGVRIYSSRFRPAADVGVELEQDTLRFVALRPGGAADRAGLKPHDRLLAIDDVPIETRLEARDVLRGARPGQVVRIKVELAGIGKPRTHEVELDPSPDEGASAVGALAAGLRSAIPFLVLAVAIGALLIRVERFEAWLLALATAGALATPPLLPMFEQIPPAARGFSLACKILFGGLAPSLVYSFLAVFPDAPSLDRLYPRIKSVWLFGSLAVAAPFACWALVSGGEPLYHSTWPAAGRWITNLAWLAALALGALSLWENATGATSRRAMPPARVIAAGSCIGLVPALAVAAAAISRGVPLADLGDWTLLAGAAGLALLPFAAAYALVATEVAPAAALLRSAARTILLRREGSIGLVVAVAAVAALGIGEWTAVRTGLGPIGGGFIALAAGALLVWGGVALLSRVRPSIERSLFRAQWEARRTVEDLAARLEPAPTIAELLDALDGELRRAFRPSSVSIYLAADEERLRIERGEVPRGMEEMPLETSLRTATGPTTIADLERATRVGPDCIAPLLGPDAKLLGLLVLGARGPAEPFTDDEILLAGTAGVEAAAGIARLRLTGTGAGPIYQTTDEKHADSRSGAIQVGESD
jgi:hypothetical protein